MQTKRIRPQAHNLTPDQMTDLKIDQTSDEGQEFAPANKRKDYQIPAVEKHLIHVELENTEFNPTTGERLSVPRVQTFYPREFDQMVADGNFKGMSVDVIHDPRSLTEAKEDLMNSTVNGGVSDMTIGKPLDEMTDQELRLKYADVYKEEPAKKMTGEALRLAITERIEFIRGEEAAARLNEDGANEDGKGDLTGVKGAQ